MNGGVLGNIFKKVANRYGDEAMNIMFDYGGDIAERGKDSFLYNQFTRGGQKYDPLLVGHSLSKEALVHNLDNYDGQLINPSIQVLNPKNSNGSISRYGDVFLLGNKSMVNPENPQVNAYSRDIFSPRHPSITTDDLGKSTIADTNIPATKDNISQYMRDQPMIDSGGKAYVGGQSAALAARMSHDYKYLGDMIKDQGNLSDSFKALSEYDRNHDAIQKLGMKEGNIEYVHELYGDDGRKYLDNINKNLLDMHAGKPIDTPYQAEYADLYDKIKNSPTEYFEVKHTKPLDLKQFTTAFVPEERYGDTIDPALKQRLVDMGIDVVPYNGRFSMNDTINNYIKKKDRFTTPYLLGGAGALPILGSLFSGSSDNNQV